MLTIDLPREHLRRGAVASMLNQSGPAIESYPTDDGRVETVAYVSGVAMPFTLLVVLMVCRWAPPLDYESEVSRKAIQDCLPWITKHIERCGLPRTLAGAENQPVLAVVNAVDQMHRHIVEGPDPPKTFAEIIRKIDEDYEMSLIDPQPI